MFEHRIDIITKDPHHLHAELTKDCPLLRLRVDIRPHLLGGAVLDCDFALIDFVFNVKYLIFICLVRLELLALPLVSSKIALILSW